MINSGSTGNNIFIYLFFQQYFLLYPKWNIIVIIYQI